METVERSGRSIVSTLLTASRGRRSRESMLERALPFVIGIGNIVLLAYFERYLGEPANRQALLLVAFLQSTQVLGYSFLQLSGPATETLRKSALLPVSSRERLLFALRSVLTDRNLIALWGGTAISILILAFSTPDLLLWAVLAYASLSVALITPLCAAFLWFIRRSTPFSILGWGMGITCGAILAGTLLFRIPSLLEAFWPVVQAADVLLNAAAGKPLAAALNLLPLALITAASIALARRVS